MDVGKKIIELRKNIGLSTNKLANMAGIAQSALRSIERGEKSPTIDTLKLILTALNITEAEFFADHSHEQELNEIDHDLLELARKIKNLPSEKRKAIEVLIQSDEF